jgi:selenide,water dikinase
MAELTQVLRHVLPVEDPNALVGHTTGDDAAVYRLTDDRALVVTADFFTPIVDDPFDFGRIAAANALSDLYAMGARPLFVLNLVAFPRKLLSEGILDEILVAVGEVHPERLVTNAGARPGDRLVLTKPVGSGIVATAIKRGEAEPRTIANAVEVMATLNDVAAEAMLEAEVRSATDVTGFGLLGHLRNLLRSSGVAAVVRSSEVPMLPEARSLAEGGHVPGGTTRNLEDLDDDVEFSDTIDPVLRILLADAQTSGGLIMCVPPDRLDGLLDALRGRTPALAVIGEVVEGPAGRIRVE